MVMRVPNVRHSMEKQMPNNDNFQLYWKFINVHIVTGRLATNNRFECASALTHFAEGIDGKVRNDFFN